jgi:putative glutamine amidotransferase
VEAGSGRKVRSMTARSPRRETTPVVGITTYSENAAWGAWNVPTALVPLSYVRSVEDAGGRALLVPPSENAVEETLDVLDGIVFSGGADLDPAIYGAEPHPETDGTRPERDRAELALMAGALQRDMPVLAVCRGLEILNVLRGGDLVQHLPDVVGDERHKHTPGVFSDHDVAVEPESRLGRILGERAPVKSHHHQGIGRLGAGLVETARADDGTVEGLEDPTRTFALAVLWHPEEQEDKALFRELVEEARRYRERERAR